jgi:hypothetical protein
MSACSGLGSDAGAAQPQRLHKTDDRVLFVLDVPRKRNFLIQILEYLLQVYARNLSLHIAMVDLKADLDQYLLLNSEKKKTGNFKIDMKMPKAPDVVTRWFGQSEPVEANSWLKDAEDTCCPKLVSLPSIKYIE